jgi:hypothetical protein
MRVSTVTCPAACALGLALVTTAAASAQSPADTVYKPGNQVENVVTGGGPSGGGPTGGDAPGQTTGGPTTGPTNGVPVAQHEVGAGRPSSLPFTGFQAGLVAVAGLALVGVGFVTRRAVRPGPEI